MKNPLKALRMTLSLTCRAAPVENAMPELSVPRMSMVSSAQRDNSGLGGVDMDAAAAGAIARY